MPAVNFIQVIFFQNIIPASTGKNEFAIFLFLEEKTICVLRAINKN
jgi:hypothetical protein